MDAVEMGRYVRLLKADVEVAIEARHAELREMDNAIQDLNHAIVFRDLGSGYHDTLRKKHPGAYSFLMCPRQQENP